MNFFELIDHRQSIREYKSIPVEPEKLQKILSAANTAPSAGNLQAFEIYVVQNHLLRQNLAQAAFDQQFIAQAPVDLVFCVHPSRSEWRYRKRGVELYTIQDASIACTFSMLAATELGLGSVWVGAFDENAVRKLIKAPLDHRPIAILSLGYAAEKPTKRDRRPLDDIVHEVD